MKNETMYFNDLLSIWLEKQKQARALSTYVKYRHLADRYISPYFRSIQLSDVDLPMLQTFRNSLLSPDSLHPLGNGTIRCILLLCICHFAVCTCRHGKKCCNANGWY